MAIQLPQAGSGKPPVCEAIKIHMRIAELMLPTIDKEYAEYPRELVRQRSDLVSSLIRKISGKLGMEGNFKNGCLYREKGLDERFKRGTGTQVCDHAVPVVDLTKMYLDDRRLNLVQLALYPVVRLTDKSNSRLTADGLANAGCKDGFPLYRYSQVEGPEIEIVTHEGVLLSTSEWTDEDHWDLVRQTAKSNPDLLEIIEHFKIFQSVG